MQIVIGSLNQSKVNFYKKVLGLEFQILSPREFHDRMSINPPAEDHFEMKSNSKNKAFYFSNLTKCVTIADDTGYFIQDLQNAPGASVRRWGGELTDDTNDEEWILFFKQKISNLNKVLLPTLKKTILTISDSNQNFLQTEILIKGHLDTSLPIFTNQGGPLSTIFVYQNLLQPEYKLSPNQYEEIIVVPLKKLINDFFKKYY